MTLGKTFHDHEETISSGLFWSAFLQTTRDFSCFFGPCCCCCWNVRIKYTFLSFALSHTKQTININSKQLKTKQSKTKQKPKQNKKNCGKNKNNLIKDMDFVKANVYAQAKGILSQNTLQATSALFFTKYEFMVIIV